jgi:hypothetical protein
MKDMKALRGFLPRAAVVAALFAAYPGTSYPGIGVSDLNSIQAEELVKTLIGCGVVVGDIRYVGDKAAAGKFSGGNGIIGFDKGIVLSSGRAAGVAGPNKSPSSGDSFTPDRRDADLESISGMQTHDAVLLEFEFIPSSTYVTFDFVFASEEYNEWANTAFNDVFAFFMNGVNVAMIPGTSTPVSINNLNGGNPYGTNTHYPQYFINNSIDTSGAPYDTEMDGFTTVISVYSPVKANTRNLIKLAVADCSDAAYNTAVFIRAGSFSSKCPDATVTSSSVFVSASMAVSPNPFRPGSGGSNDAANMTFRSVPAGGTLRLYTTSGRLVYEAADSDGDGMVVWDARNSSGKPAASGVYFYVAKGPDGTVKRGKVVVIR